MDLYATLIRNTGAKDAIAIWKENSDFFFIFPFSQTNLFYTKPDYLKLLQYVKCVHIYMYINFIVQKKICERK